MQGSLALLGISSEGGGSRKSPANGEPEGEHRTAARMRGKKENQPQGPVHSDAGFTGFFGKLSAQNSVSRPSQHRRAALSGTRSTRDAPLSPVSRLRAETFENPAELSGPEKS